ncbi:hypothetical protein Dip518_001563 [Parelusimicrobium proximum]|uniref:hypothetical protein n=1 Tax=Parelusimicrobium proximum TaxID=3228953 RepID=UPI003D17E4A5
MKRTAFVLLIVLLGAVFGVGIEYLAKTFFSGKLLSFFVKVYGNVGVHPLSINFTMSGVLGLICSYFLIDRLVKK